MALDQETINAQLTQLASHRQRLALLLQQQAKLGGYSPPYVLIDIREAQDAIRRIKQQLRTDGVPVEDEPNDEVQPAAFTPPSRLAPQEQRNRRAMLAKVKSIWIEGLLEQSLAKELRIALDLTEQPDAVVLPLNALVQELLHPPRPLPTGTPIFEVFEQMGSTLLILGAPGAGKTTLLLELARDLIARAEQDEGYPIPVVFNLSSWAAKRQPLKDWLVEELNTKYDVPGKLAQAWVDADAVLPLLDGLDEVSADRREACVDAINAYREQHGLVPLAVCSRVADYAALTTKLRLQGAVVVQTLTQPQVEAYLERAGEKLAGVRAALHSDAELGEMLETPLMLSIAALAYAGKSVEEVPATGTSDERRRHLFGAYIAAMFKRRGKQINYTWQHTICWLSWLARQMVQHKQTQYYIERMQPNWLRRWGRLWFVLSVRLLCGLISGLSFGIAGGLLGGFVEGLLGTVEGGLLTGLLVGLLIGFFGGPSRSDELIRVTETLHWSRSRTRLGSAVVIGLVVGIFSARLVGGIIGAVIGGGVGIGFALLAGLSGAELEMKVAPNQGIHRSARSWLLVWLLVCLLIGAFVAVGVGRNRGLVVGLGVGLSSGLVVGLDYGGRAVLQHYTLRWLLYRNGFLPLRLVPFLDHCAERIFLRKVGGGYIFVHRLLMEHFASLYSERPDETAQRVLDN